jgi:hypothetical protein
MFSGHSMQESESNDCSENPVTGANTKAFKMRLETHIKEHGKLNTTQLPPQTNSICVQVKQNNRSKDWNVWQV